MQIDKALRKGEKLLVTEPSNIYNYIRDQTVNIKKDYDDFL